MIEATFDSNHDGVLDARDTRFADFKVWTDANSNGTVDAGEMQTLAQRGSAGVDLPVAIKRVAACAMNTRTGGQFGTWSRLVAANDACWRAVA